MFLEIDDNIPQEFRSEESLKRQATKAAEERTIELRDIPDQEKITFGAELNFSSPDELRDAGYWNPLQPLPRHNKRGDFLKCTMTYTMGDDVGGIQVNEGDVLVCTKNEPKPHDWILVPAVRADEPAVPVMSIGEMNELARTNPPVGTTVASVNENNQYQVYVFDGSEWLERGTDYSIDESAGTITRQNESQNTVPERPSWAREISHEVITDPEQEAALNMAECNFQDRVRTILSRTVSETAFRDFNQMMNDGRLMVICLRIGGKLRIRALNPEFNPEWNCQFPKSWREPDAIFSVDSIQESAKGGFYVAKSRNFRRHWRYRV